MRPCLAGWLPPPHRVATAYNTDTLDKGGDVSLVGEWDGATQKDNFKLMNYLVLELSVNPVGLLLAVVNDISESMALCVALIQGETSGEQNP